MFRHISNQSIRLASISKLTERSARENYFLEPEVQVGIHFARER